MAHRSVVDVQYVIVVDYVIGSWESKDFDVFRKL